MQGTAQLRPDLARDAMAGFGLAHGGFGAGSRPVWRVHLVRRETGEVLRLNGLPLVVYAKDATAAVASLMEGRNPALWRAEIGRVAAQEER